MREEGGHSPLVVFSMTGRKENPNPLPCLVGGRNRRRKEEEGLFVQ